MMRSSFLTHVNHNDDVANESAPENNISMAERRRFTTPASVNDDLRREIDGYTHRTAWAGEDTAYVNGLPLYAPARYFDKGGNVQARAQQAAAKPATTWKGPAASAAPASGGPATVTVERQIWPWWIWPLAAAAAVAVRGQ